MEEVPFSEVARADLVIDRMYAGGVAGNRGDDPISKILPVGNAGGFRFLGSPTRGTVRALVLYTSMADLEWPDRLDLGSGTFTYYGDNKKPGRELHDTHRKGNLALRDMFQDAGSAEHRRRVPPILLFSKAGRGAGVTFRGLLVPGAATVPSEEQLVAIWRSSGDKRFQNYRSLFTVLDARLITRAWLDDIQVGHPMTANAPGVWSTWVRTGIPDPLLAPRSVEHRTREQQLPTSRSDMELLAIIHRHFAERPTDFEYCAAHLWWMLAPATDELEVTRPSRDGGRDAVGRYKIGPPADQIRIDFALEAKCYGPTTAVGVRDISRLISRLRHRNFGVLVTTSYVHAQAYREVRDDQRPVAIVCGRDIVDLLKSHGLGTPVALRAWLESEFPPDISSRSDLAFPLEAVAEIHAGAYRRQAAT